MNWSELSTKLIGLCLELMFWLKCINAFIMSQGFFPMLFQAFFFFLESILTGDEDVKMN